MSWGLVFVAIAIACVIIAWKLTSTNASYDTLIKSYSSKPRADVKDKIMISFFVPHENIQSLKPFLKSLLSQTKKVDQVVMNVMESDLKDVPSEYKQFVQVYGVGKNYGEGCKIIPTLLREPHANTNILVVDPTKTYDKNLVEKMVSAFKSENGKVVERKDEAAILFRPDQYCSKIDSSCTQSDTDKYLSKFLTCEKKVIE